MIILRTIFVLIVFLIPGTVLAADGHPAGFSNHKFNPPGHDPITTDGVTRFHVNDGICSDVKYGDGRGETDCKNGSVRSILAHRGASKVGKSIEYRFDIRIDPSISLEPYKNIAATKYIENGTDSHLRLASWEGEFLHNFYFALKADSKRGITFLGETCQAAADLGQWVSFTLAVSWTGDERGWIRVTCNDALVYAREDTATNQAPHCYESNQCLPGEYRNPKTVFFALGPVVQGNGQDWEETGKSALFNEIQNEGIKVEMRNVSVRNNPAKYLASDIERIKELQSTLNRLGCDVGVVDGIPGKKTKAALQSCKLFDEGELPNEWSVQNLGTFLKLYNSEGVEQRKEGDPDRDKITTLAHNANFETNAYLGGVKNRRELDFDFDIEGKVKPKSGKKFNLSFVLSGSIDKRSRRPDSLRVTFQYDLSKSDVAAYKQCDSANVDRWQNGTSHIYVEYKMSPKGLVPPELDCILEQTNSRLRPEVDFVLNHLRETAISIVQTGGLVGITDEKAKAVLTELATNEFIGADGNVSDDYETISPDAGALDGQIQSVETLGPNPDFETNALISRVKKGVSDLEFDFGIEGNVTSKLSEPFDLGFLLYGTLDNLTGKLFSLDVSFQTELSADDVAKYGKCSFTTIQHWSDGTSHIVLKFQKISDDFIPPQLDCIVKQSNPHLQLEIEFVMKQLKETAISIVRSGGLNGVKNDNIERFLTDLATGKLKVEKANFF